MSIEIKPTPFQVYNASAGSGKTFCLAHRAMNYANNDKTVLFTYYTSSFKSYINAILKQPPIDYKRRIGKYDDPSITVENLHMLMSSMLDDYYSYLNLNGRKDDEGKDFRNRYTVVPEKKRYNEVSFARKIIRLLNYDEQLFFEAIGNKYSYDSILVDEGQNFKSEWFTVLHRVGLRNRPKDQTYGDMMVAFDEQQKLFGDNDGESIKKLSDASLIEDPLLATYRIPAQLFEKINLVRTKLDLQAIEYHIPNRKELDYMSKGDYEWINIPKTSISVEDKSQFIVKNTLKIIKENKLKYGDCAIVTDDHILMAKIQNEIAKLKNIEMETITDDIEILDKKTNHDTMLFTRCDEKSKKKLYDLLLASNSIHQLESWMLSSKELKMETYGEYDAKEKTRLKRRSYDIFNTEKFTLLFPLYKSKKDMDQANMVEIDDDKKEEGSYVPGYARTPKLYQGDLDKISNIEYEKAYQWDRAELPTHKLTQTAEKLRNQGLKKGYDFSEKNSLITHTIKSFQGQELPHIFIYLSNKFNKDNINQNQSARYLAWQQSWDYENYVNQLFVALTRARRSAWIYNGSESLDYIADEFNR